MNLKMYVHYTSGEYREIPREEGELLNYEIQNTRGKGDLVAVHDEFVELIDIEGVYYDIEDGDTLESS